MFKKIFYPVYITVTPHPNLEKFNSIHTLTEQIKANTSYIIFF